MMSSRLLGRSATRLALLQLASALGDTKPFEDELRIRKLANSPPFAPLPPKIHERRAKGHNVIPDRLLRKSRRPR